MVLKLFIMFYVKIAGIVDLNQVFILIFCKVKFVPFYQNSSFILHICRRNNLYCVL